MTPAHLQRGNAGLMLNGTPAGRAPESNPQSLLKREVWEEKQVGAPDPLGSAALREGSLRQEAEPRRFLSGLLFMRAGG